MIIIAKYAVLNSFYTSEKWANFRLRLIAERGPYCQRCKKLIPKSIEIIGHHKKELSPENVKDYTISLNPDLVELICHDCHNQEHNRFGYSNGHGVNIVFGPPLSGKKTYVQQYISRGDIVVDMDQLYSAISLLPYYDKPDNLFNNVIGIHNLLIDNIKTRYGKWHKAWVIGGYADKYKRERLADSLGAELIFCDVSKEECLRRLEMDEDRRYRQDEWRKYIERWFDEYVE